jgi:hypothetical protein
MYRTRETHEIIGCIVHYADSYEAELSSGRTAIFSSFRSANAYVMLWADDLEQQEVDQ